MNKILTTVGPLILGIAGAAASAECPEGAVPEDAIRERVRVALHADQYFYDKHVTVSMEHGDVVLQGIVFGDWDLRVALRIASTAACNRRVIDQLKLVTGGYR
jgi:osmotically-inducible protein OsmY